MKISELLKNAVDKRGGRDYIFEKKDGAFRGRSFDRFTRDVYRLAHRLIDLGASGRTVMIIGANSYEWMVADLAVTAFVGVSMGVNCRLGADAVSRVAREAKAGGVIFAEDKRGLAERLSAEGVDIALCMSDIAALPDTYGMFDLPDRDENICSKIVFSSGTTGPSKGIKLSLKNIFAGYDDFYRRLRLDENDSSYMFLPLNHTYADIYHFYYSLIGGYSLYLATSPSAIAQELREVEPTVFCAVPLVFERLIALYGDRVGEAFGTRVRYIVTGGAPCGRELRRALSGLTLLQTYALSEMASSFAIDYPDDRDEESSGTIFESVDARIADPDENGVGEIIAKGDCVFLGYLDPGLTGRAFDEDGYYHTGDLGYIRDNKIYITGRKKRIITGSNGENIDVEALESLLLSLDGGIAGVRIYMKSGRLNADIFTRGDADVAAAVRRYNDRVLPYEAVDRYDVFEFDPESRMK